jgi:hypothetical protein
MAILVAVVSLSSVFKGIYFYYLLQCFNMFHLCISFQIIVFECECVFFEQGFEDIHQTFRGLREASTLVFVLMRWFCVSICIQEDIKIMY